MSHLLVLGRQLRPIVVHLNARDVTMVAVSRAPLEKLEAYNLVPKGRDEENRRPHWVRRHDEYASR